MQVVFSEEGKRLIARLQGRLEAADGAEFAAAVDRRMRTGSNSLTIDLDQLDSISFGGIRALLRLARSLKGERKDLDFLGGGHAVREHLDQAGLDDFFPFTPPFVSTRGAAK